MEQLTNQERMKRFYNREAIDRIPVCTNATVFSGVFARMSSEEFFGNMQNMYNAQKLTRELFGCHFGPSFCLPNWIALSLGCTITYRDSKQGIMIPQVSPVITSDIEAEMFIAPKNPQGDALKMRQEFIQIAGNNGKGKIALNAGSVMEIVAQITDMSLLLRWMVRKPELVYHLCDEVMAYLLRLIDQDITIYGAQNCMAMFFYPLESKELMSPRLVRKFHWVYIEKMHRELQARGIHSFHEHLCGNQSDNLELFRDLSLPAGTCFSLDEKNDILETAKKLGNDYVIEGNVSSNILLTGSVQEVMNCCEEIIKAGKKLEGGFILSPSCDLPPYTPPLNLYAMHRAACIYGKY